MRIAAAAAFIAFILSFTSASAATSTALDQFAKAWSALNGYTATIQLYEVKSPRDPASGNNVEHAMFAYTFRKPQSVTMHVNQGPNAGATVTWSGGPTVSASKSGPFGIAMSKNKSLSDPLVTSLRGYTVADLSLPGILAHAQQTAGSSYSGTTTVNGGTVTAVTLNVANPSQDNGMTREVLYLSQSTQLPVRIDGFVGDQLVRMYRFTITKTW
jgi:hypothetical protein